MLKYDSDMIVNRGMLMPEIVLYPSSWLYNAGVIGFLRVLKECGETVENFLKDDGSVEIEESKIEEILKQPNGDGLNPFDKFGSWHRYYIKVTFYDLYNDSNFDEAIKKTIDELLKVRNDLLKKRKKEAVVSVDENKIKGKVEKNFVYADFFTQEELNKIKSLLEDENKTEPEISKEIYEILSKKEKQYKYRKAVAILFPSGGYYQNFFNPSNFRKVNKFLETFKSENFLKIADTNINVNINVCSFCTDRKFKVEPINFMFMSFLFPANSFKNSYWNLDDNNLTNICSLCKFFVIHFHLGMIKLQGGSEIFINAPSFKLMWNLNNYVRTLYGRKEITGTKEVLGISLIELSTKINIHLGRWEKMNIEVVSKYHDKIDFFSLPSDIVDLLTNREIASLLKQIGEFKILNMVLDGEFNGILEFGEKALRDAMKRKSGKDTGTDFINEDIKLKKNKEDLFSFSQKLFKLYALIKSELKKEVIA